MHRSANGSTVHVTEVWLPQALVKLDTLVSVLILPQTESYMRKQYLTLKY